MFSQPPAHQTSYRSYPLPAVQATNQQPARQATNQQPARQETNQSSNQPISQPNSPPVSQPTSQPTNQPTNQSINQQDFVPNMADKNIAAKSTGVSSAESSPISNHFTLASDIMKCINEQRKREDFSDVVVVLEGTEFPSHRFILSACSGFFRGLLVSGMKEDKAGRVDIFGISRETFTLVLDCIYHADDILDVDNMVDIWHAANQLDVPFLLKLSEDFILKNIGVDNCLEVYENAKLLDCKKIVDLSWEIILKSFDSLRQGTDILNLSFDDMKSLLGSYNLRVKSEDHVIDVILRWISHIPSVASCPYLQLQEKPIGKTEQSRTTISPSCGASSGVTKQHTVLEENDEKDHLSDTEHEVENVNSKAIINQTDKQSPSLMSRPPATEELFRHIHLVDLLSEARYCLLSGNTIQQLLSNKSVTANEEAMSIVKESICYQLEPWRRHDHCPAAAVHRACSNVQNTLTWMTIETLSDEGEDENDDIDEDPDKICVLVFMNVVDNTIRRKKLETLKSACHLTPYGNFLYIVGDGGFYRFDSLKMDLSELSKFKPRTGHALAAVGEYLYIIGGANNQVERMNITVDSVWESVGSMPVAITNTTTAVFRSYIIILGCHNGRNDTTVVQCFNTETMTSTRLSDIEGPPQRLTSFRKGDETFILFRTGALWKMEMSETGVLYTRYVTMLWDFDRSLRGAVLCQDSLYLFYDVITQTVEPVWHISLPGVFKSIRNISEGGFGFCNSVVSNSFSKS